MEDWYPKKVKKIIIGKSFQGNDIPAYYLGHDVRDDDVCKAKFGILFTGAHNGNDFLTVQMIVKIFLEQLHHIVLGN